MLCPAAALAVDVDEVVWGFDGQVVKHRFNPVSILFSNPKPEAFEGAVRLRTATGPGNFTGAPVEELLYISPFSKKWVQFYPYNLSDHEQWSVSWGRRADQRFDLPQPKFGNPGRVILEDSQALTEQGGAMKRFPDNLFPPFVTATDGLHTVVLDHVPRWEESRRQAFLDWVRRGGTVHLLHTNADRYPEFSADLAAALNAPVDTNHVGAGVVVRHPRTRSQLDREFVRTTILGEKPESTESGANLSDAEKEIAERQKKVQQAQQLQQQQQEQQEDYNLFDYRGDEIFFDELQTMTRPKHNWIVIHLMSFIYILVIFPGCFLIGRQRGDYRKTYAVLLATVAIFSVGFSVVGARGYGESTTVNAVAIAQDIGDGTWDVSQWSNAFVTRGDYFKLEHQGGGVLYSPCQQMEAVNGVIHNGTNGEFQVDIPPYSARNFAHRVKLKDDGWRYKLVEWDRSDDGQLTKLVLDPPGPLPDKLMPMHVLHRRGFQSLTVSSGRFELAGQHGDLAGFLRVGQNQQYQYQQRGFPFATDERTPEQRYTQMTNPLIARSLSLGKTKDLAAFSLPDDRVRIFTYAPMPAGFATKGEWFGKQQGHVMFVQDVWLDEEVRRQKSAVSEKKPAEEK
ncbi:MAG: hypothetical protein HZA46_15450 [Planctomycetales bacterium]|nr:hypothetical protein [Planctomycetales bacterium]